MKTCKKCEISQDGNNFYLISKSKNKYRATCKSCHALYVLNNKEKISLKRKEHRINNKYLYMIRNQTEKRRAQNRRSKQNTKVQTNKRERHKRQINRTYTLRKYLSKTISRALFNNGGSKSMSFLKCVTYTMEELKIHLESLFEPWMTWDNYGMYKRDSWDENDQSTWTWNLDHIKPQSTLPYKSMEEDNFKLCWDLNNLRPLSAKQNLLEGARK